MRPNPSASPIFNSLKPHSTSQVTPETWRRFFTQFSAIAGVIALVLALVFFIAYNWMDMGKMGKFGLVEAALTLSIVGYAVLAYKRRYPLGQQLLLLVASILTGSLLALIGQVYQTGADSWQLFFSWAILIIPWVIIARLPALWLLWLGLINLCLSLYAKTGSFLFQDYIYSDLLYLLALTGLNFAALTFGLKVTDHQRNTGSVQSLHWSVYIVGSLVIFWATRLGLFSIGLWSDTLSTIVSFVAWGSILSFFYWRFRQRSTDLLMLTLLNGSFIVVLMVLVSQYIAPHLGDAALIVLALLLIGLSGGAVNWLRQLNHQIRPQPAKLESNSESVTCYRTEDVSEVADEAVAAINAAKSPVEAANTPWYLQLLLAISGLVSGALITGFLVVVFNIGLRDMVMNLILSVLLFSISFVLFNLHLFRRYPTSHKSHSFSSGLAFALSLSAQAFLISTLAEHLTSEVTMVSSFMLLQLLLFILFNDTLHRFFSAFLGLGCLVWLLSYYQIPELSAPLLALLASSITLPNSKLMQAISAAKYPLTETLFKSVNYASTLMLLMVSVVLIVAENTQSIVGVDAQFTYNYYLAQALLIAVSLYIAHLILGQYSLKLHSKTGGLIALAIIGLGVVSIYISGILTTSLVIILAIANANKTLLALGISALVGYIFWYYYQLDTSLLQKSGSLLAVSVLLFAVYKLLTSHYFTPVNSTSLAATSTSKTLPTDEELS